MAVRLIRYVAEGSTYWGRVHEGGDVTALDDDYPTTGALLESGRREWLAADRGHPTHLLSEVSLTSPVTTPCRVICQDLRRRRPTVRRGAVSVRDHSFFDKTDASVTGPCDPVCRPRHVRRLDYGVRLGLVIGAPITEPITITDDELPHYVAAVTIGNGLSARERRRSRDRSLAAQSLRGFCPVGPELIVLDESDFTLLDHLALELRVNGRLRQTETAAKVLLSPARALTELSTFCDLAPGDVVFTITPPGTAGSPRVSFSGFAGAALPHEENWRRHTPRHLSGGFLRPGDVVTASVRTPCGTIDLGEQRTTIVGGGPLS